MKNGYMVGFADKKIMIVEVMKEKFLLQMTRPISDEQIKQSKKTPICSTEIKENFATTEIFLSREALGVIKEIIEKLEI